MRILHKKRILHQSYFIYIFSQRKKPTLRDVTIDFTAMKRLSNKSKNSVLMKCHPQSPDLGSAYAWSKQISPAARPIRNTTQIWFVTCHQYGISAFVLQASFRGETGEKSPAVFSGYCILRGIFFYFKVEYCSIVKCKWKHLRYQPKM